MARTRRRVWIARVRALCWAVAGVAAFPLGWVNSIAFVVIASVYANVASDLGVAEAADNTDLIARLDAMERASNTRYERLESQLAALARQVESARGR